ncbi:MAG TPA: galactonate dehydratase [Thermomicrobiales bacterium]|nr:galactonate dehydratase [Thermomicrobiales bacterium]
MKIAKLETFILGTAWRNLIFVQLTTDDGLTGLGEASMTNFEDSVLGYLRSVSDKYVIGSDPFDIEDLWLRMFRNDFWRGGPIALTGISAIEIACWDIVGKALGVPCWKLLGGKTRDRLKAYANGWYQVERTPDAFAAATKKVLARGYKGFKLDPFGAGDYELSRDERLRSIAIVEAVRDAVGPEIEIMIEMHGRFSPATAARIAHELEPFDPTWVEEPVPPENAAELRRAAEQIRVPVATGERCFTRYGFKEILQYGGPDVIQPDIIHCGGMLELKKIAAMADAYFVTVAPHNSQGPVCTAASVHVDFTLTNFKVQECFDDFVEPFIKQATPGVPEVNADGYFELPQAPGLGVALDHDVLAAHPRRDVHFNLWAVDWQFRQAGMDPARHGETRQGQ